MHIFFLISKVFKYIVRTEDLQDEIPLHISLSFYPIVVHSLDIIVLQSVNMRSVLYL